MLQILIAIIGILITIFFVIGTHEAAHFFAARWLGVKVIRFSIGFGKTLYRFHDKKHTEYVIALIPLGGYVKMADENEGDVAPRDLPHAFNRQPFYKKFLIVLAGPAANILCALVLYWLIFIIGFTTIKPVIGQVNPRSIAASAGLAPNQEIISIDGKKTSAWSGVIFRLLVHVGNKDFVKIAVKKPDNTTETYTLDLTDWQLNNLTPDPLASLGITPYEPPIPLIIGVIAAKSPALNSELKIGDKIIAIDNTPVKKWEEIIKIILAHPGTILKFKIERDKKIYEFPVQVGYQRGILWNKSGYLGIAPTFKLPPSMLHEVKYDPLSAVAHATQEIIDFTYFNLLLFWKMITGKISVQSLGGPITIFETAGDALNYGFLAFIGFLAFLSISIGVINLIPVPGLDGGHLVIFLVEFIIRRPVPLNVLLLLYRLGFILIILLLFQALVNDILRLY